ncbi:MAG TPA: hypothetical protein VK927_09735, partial [Adhaeribacter sp.]|nr:hypothetical protein [Adhaeribacter sp.]
MLDDFNRSNNVVVGAPAGNGTQTWMETETAGSNDYRIRIENNMLVMGSHNNAGTGSSGLEQISYNADGLYATTFNQASGNLTWSFNFRQSRVGLSGFGATTYGIAYVLGSTHETFTHPAANGYAIVMGNSGSPDPVRLVRFANGLTANSKVTDILAASTETNETAYYSIKVTFDPCSKSWSLQVRNDGSNGFADPATVTSTPLTATDQFFTNTNLNFTGAAYNHGTVSVTAFFDNISVPTATATAVDYVWTGAASTDFENPENWSPSRTCFRTSDKLHFDSGKPEFITNVTSQTFSSFWVKNHTVLTLTAKTGATQTLSILDGDNQDLLVEAGSSLIID